MNDPKTAALEALAEIRNRPRVDDLPRSPEIIHAGSGVSWFLFREARVLLEAQPDSSFQVTVRWPGNTTLDSWATHGPLAAAVRNVCWVINQRLAGAEASN